MTSLRETKKAATRAALAESAAHIALSQGAEGLTVAAIAEEAGVSPRTFHNYFSSREEALFHAIARRVEAFMEDLDDLPPGLTFLNAMEEVAIRGLHRDPSHFASLSSLTRLGEVGEILGKGEMKNSLEQEFDCLIEKFLAHFPGLSEFEAKVTLGATSHAVAIALLKFYQQPTQDLHEGERLIHQAFEVLRGLG
ncbi:TetR/AcrR family transcriptional regulator [Corynebacterium oculi]|uniref:HTH-type transcriptional regulator BetI n=1 Tax=Corynebacterium oculi TaxID=1544416 RepID=A0A0Q0UBI1_9CORY|nr:TetR/AcrR family transcriptional regulator [Corynebacterium oculi]KQB83579.1 HTH-type transcriptional regulator BetI [Corynebacterium oculi]